jgi:hypothetical protein
MRLQKEHEKLITEQKGKNERVEADIKRRLDKATKNEEETEKLKEHVQETNAELVHATQELAPKLKEL